MIAGMGIALGFPWHLDSGGKHEIRFGLGLSAGTIRQFSYCEPSEDRLFGERKCVHAQQAFGFLLSPEIYSELLISGERSRWRWWVVSGTVRAISRF